MDKNQLKNALLAGGFESAHLDSTVHDAASSMASGANNDGVEGQINFLVDVCGWTTEAILAAVKGE